jgi:hypothetical protein
MTFEDGTLSYRGAVLQGQEVLLQRILRLAADGIDFQPLLNFITKLQHNVSYRVREQLYRLLERSRLPITPDGCFLADKPGSSSGSRAASPARARPQAHIRRRGGLQT